MNSSGQYLDGGGDEEVLLLQPELLALVGAVVRVQHAAQRLCPLPRQNGLRAHTKQLLSLSECNDMA